MLRSLHKYANTAALIATFGQRIKCFSAQVNFKPETEYIQVKENDGVREIILNHSKTLNSLSMGLMDELHCAMNYNINSKELRCILLSANGKIFSTGHNLKELIAQKDKQHEAFNKLSAIILDIRAAPVPIIAKVNGYAAAAGVQLVASCDIVICTPTSKFSTPGVNTGVFCSTPGIALSRTMSHTKARYMLLTGIPISGEEAYTAGLASKCVSEDKLNDEIETIVKSIKDKSRAIIAYGKKFYYRQETLPLIAAYAEGTKTMCDNLKLADCQEGINSFFEKRKPNWHHE